MATQPPNADQIRSDLAVRIATHVCAEEPVRSFRFTSPENPGSYWFVLTWTPGQLTLTGDLDEMVLTHYSALREFRSGIQWAASGTYDYLIEKSNFSTASVLDREATVRSIIEEANSQDCLHSRKMERRERRDYRAWRARAEAEWAAEHAEYLRTIEDDPDSPAQKPELADYLDPWDNSPYVFTERYLSGLVYTKIQDTAEPWNVPEGWQDWYRIWRYVDDAGYMSFEDNFSPNGVLTARGRRAVAADLMSMVTDMSESDVANMCRTLGYDDWYGSRHPPVRTVQQIEAIRVGAQAILATRPAPEAGD